MGVLLKARRSSKGLATLWAGMGPSPNMGSSDVPLKIGGVSENFVTIFTREPAEFTMDHLVPQKIGPPCKGFWTMVTCVLRGLVAVGFHHVII